MFAKQNKPEKRFEKLPDERPKYSAEELDKVVLKYTVANSTKPPVDKVQYIDKLKPITLAQSEI